MRRPSRRYLVFKIVSGNAFSSDAISAEIERSLRTFFGDVGVLHSFVRLISCDATKMMGVLRCSVRWLIKVRAALALITRIDGQPVALLVLKSSGTLASLRRSLDPNNSWIEKRHQRRVPPGRK